MALLFNASSEISLSHISKLCESVDNDLVVGRREWNQVRLEKKVDPFGKTFRRSFTFSYDPRTTLLQAERTEVIAYSRTHIVLTILGMCILTFQDIYVQ